MSELLYSLVLGWFVLLCFAALVMFLARKRDDIDHEAGVQIDNLRDNSEQQKEQIEYED